MSQNQGKENFKTFCSTTTAHGFSYLVAPSKNIRIIWLVIIIVATACCSYHLYTLGKQYFLYGYYESTVINTEISPMFPDITICDNTGIAESAFAR